MVSLSKKTTRRGGRVSRSKKRTGGVTMDHVAREAGVSLMTVSRVMNNVPGVKASTRDSVMRAVKALGYSPNAAARSLARNGAGRIGLLRPDGAGRKTNDILASKPEKLTTKTNGS